jgi:peptidoglycan hydrolase-like protein with peptidoglycan-binding domain
MNLFKRLFGITSTESAVPAPQQQMLPPVTSTASAVTSTESAVPAPQQQMLPPVTSTASAVTSTASAVPAPQQQMLPPGWEIIMDGATPNYFHAGMGKLQTKFPQPERDPEPKRELPAGWRKEEMHNGWDKWVEYVNTLDPRAKRERSFPTEPAQRPLSPLFEQFTVGEKIMYRHRSNKDVTADFQPASDAQIAKMWEDSTRYESDQSRGGKRKQSKRKQSKRKQSKQSKRKQSKKSH